MPDLVPKRLRLRLDRLAARFVLLGSFHARHLHHIVVVLLDEVAQLDQVILHLLIVVQDPLRRRLLLQVIELEHELVRVQQAIIAITVVQAVIEDGGDNTEALAL